MSGKSGLIYSQILLKKEKACLTLESKMWGGVQGRGTEKINSSTIS